MVPCRYNISEHRGVKEGKIIEERSIRVARAYPHALLCGKYPNVLEGIRALEAEGFPRPGLVKRVAPSGGQFRKIVGHVTLMNSENGRVYYGLISGCRTTQMQHQG